MQKDSKHAHAQAAHVEFKNQALELQGHMRKQRDLGAWVPQKGRVSGRTHWLNVVTGQVRVCVYVGLLVGFVSARVCVFICLYAICACAFVGHIRHELG